MGIPPKNYPFYSWKGKEDMGIPNFLLISALYLGIKKKREKFYLSSLGSTGNSQFFWFVFAFPIFQMQFEVWELIKFLRIAQ